MDHNVRIFIGMVKVSITRMYIPLPRNFEFEGELGVWDSDAVERTSDYRICQRELDPVNRLLKLGGLPFIVALQASPEQMYHFFT